MVAINLNVLLITKVVNGFLAIAANEDGNRFINLNNAIVRQRYGILCIYVYSTLDSSFQLFNKCKRIKSAALKKNLLFFVVSTIKLTCITCICNKITQLSGVFLARHFLNTTTYINTIRLHKSYRIFNIIWIQTT